jgi:hypothetical protein
LSRNPKRAGPQPAEDVVVLLERGQDQDPGARRGAGQLAGGRDAVEVGHLHIHQHHVGFTPPGQRDCLAAGRRLADHLDPRI